MKVKTFETKDEIEDFLVEYFYRLSNEEINKKGFFSVALSGGNTPLGFYKKLSCEKDILWDKIHVFFVDERMVSDDNEKSNTYQISKYLINPLNLKNVHYINKEIDAADSVQKYERHILNFFKDKPSFDFILLGIGEDGHTASIFPRSNALKEKKKLVIKTQKEGENFSRISFTLPLINQSKNIILIAVGSEKAEVIRQIIIDKNSSLPAQVIAYKRDDIFILLDRKSSELI